MMHVARCISIWCICSPWVNDFVAFLFIRMPLQDMDKHLDILKICCRLCGKKLVKGARKTKVQLLQEHIVKLWGQNVLLDSPGVHPQFACNSCRAICTNARYKSGQLNVKDVLVWTPHQDGNCRVCMSFPKKSKPGRKKKMQMKTKTISHRKEQEIESSTDTASQDSECDIDDDCAVFSLFMDNLRQSSERIPLSNGSRGRRYEVEPTSLVIGSSTSEKLHAWRRSWLLSKGG